MNIKGKIQTLAKLLEIQNFYIDEAEKCLETKAFFAGCVMMASALEAVLLLMIALYSEELNKLNKPPMRKRKRIAPINYNLGQCCPVN